MFPVNVDRLAGIDIAHPSWMNHAKRFDGTRTIPLMAKQKRRKPQMNADKRLEKQNSIRLSAFMCGSKSLRIRRKAPVVPSCASVH
jgi:hypothetical protein